MLTCMYLPTSVRNGIGGGKFSHDRVTKKVVQKKKEGNGNSYGHKE